MSAQPMHVDLQERRGGRALRIAFLHGAALPSLAASTVQVMKMCEALAAAGHAVTLLVPDRPDALPDAGDIHDFYGVRRVFDIRKVAWSRRGPGRIAAALHMSAAARASGVELVYSRFPLGAYACALRGLPVVMELHRPLRTTARLDAWAIRRLVRHPGFRHVVAISAALRRLLEPELPQVPIIVAHDGADRALAEQQVESRCAARPRLAVGYVGSLLPGRGIELIVELARRCHEAADFEVIGGSEAEVHAWRARCEQIANLHFRGHMRHADAQRRLQELDVLLAPYASKVSVIGDPSADTSAYMSPLKVFEYMAAGKPIVCSDHETLREVLTHEQTALICRREDVADWARAVARLAAEGELRRRLGAAARAVFLRHYTWDARARSVLPADALAGERLQCL